MNGVILSGVFAAAADAPLNRESPAFLYEKPLPPIKENLDFTREETAGDAIAERETLEITGKKRTSRRYAPFRDHRRFTEKAGVLAITGQPPGSGKGNIVSAPMPAAVAASASGADAAEPAVPADSPAEQENAASGVPAVSPSVPPAETAPLPPTPESIEAYRSKLEDRLLERYNNLPVSAGKVAKVSVVATKPLEVSLDGSLIKAEFDQLVYDVWGKRMPALEKEYYVVTFGSGGVAQVRSDPSIRVGLDLEKSYSERVPLAADPFRHVEDYDAFTDEPKTAMPGWWRPEYPELY